MLDCNNFFVSCERLFRPDLRRLPVIVLSSNDGCVVARSQEVKDMGVPMGIPVFQIKDIIKDKDITTFSSNFTLYRDISARVMTVLRGQLSIIEQYSIDEAFFEIECESEAALNALLRRLKQIVEQRVGVPVSLGAASTKTQAKYANRLAKKSPDGVMVTTDEWWKKEASNVFLCDIWGVGRRLGQAYSKYKIEMVGDLLSAPKLFVAEQFGIVGVRLQAELSGLPQYPVGVLTELPRSLMSTRSFAEVTHSKAALKDALSWHLHQVSAELRAKGLVAASLSVIMRPGRFSNYSLYRGSQTRVLAPGTANTARLLCEVNKVVEELFRVDVPYKKAGIVLSQLRPKNMVSGTLWAQSEAVFLQDKLEDLLDTLRSTHGKNVIQQGRYADSQIWQSKRSCASPAYTTRWSEVALVRA